MATKPRRALSEAQAKRCEEACHPRCKCRCGGKFQVTAPRGAYPDRAAFEQLPEDDPHHLPPKGKKRTVQPADFFHPPYILSDGNYRYAGYFDIPSACHLRVYTRVSGEPIFVATELPTNPGTSITNRAEYLAAEAVHEFAPRWAGKPFAWIEHYRHYPRRTEEDTFDLVSFDSWTPVEDASGCRTLGRPSWTRLTLDEVRAYCGEVPL